MVACRVVQEGDGDAAAVQARLSMQLAAVQTRLAVRGLGPKVELEVGHMLDSPLELATQLLHRLCMHVPWRGTVCSSMRTRERGLVCVCVYMTCVRVLRSHVFEPFGSLLGMAPLQLDLSLPAARAPSVT